MCVRVVNVRGLNRPEQRAGVVYVGRPFAGWSGHPLANPYRPGADLSPGRCLDRYREWLWRRPTLEADLAALWDQCGHGTKPLGCWCVNAAGDDGRDAVCHAQILARLLVQMFAPHTLTLARPESAP